MSSQMANETNLCTEKSWTVRTSNGGDSGGCGSAFCKFPVQVSCFVSSGFTDFRSSFDNLTPLVSVLCQIFPAIRGNTERIYRDLQCVFEALSLASFGALALREHTVEQFLREAVILHADNMTGLTKL